MDSRFIVGKAYECRFVLGNQIKTLSYKCVKRTNDFVFFEGVNKAGARIVAPLRRKPLIGFDGKEYVILAKGIPSLKIGDEVLYADQVPSPKRSDGQAHPFGL